MDDKSERSARELLLGLIASDINLARAFAVVARSAYGLGKVDEGDIARGKAMKFYSEARRAVLQIAEQDRESPLSELESLRTSVEWLSMQTGVASPPSSTRPESGLRHGLRRVLKGES